MARTNKISTDFKTGDKDVVITKLNEVIALMPFLISLSLEERKKNGNMGPKSVAYVQQCLEAAIAFPAELKANFKVAEFQNDVTLINNLMGVRVLLGSLYESVNDTIAAAGIDSMGSSSEVYDSLKSSAKSNANVKTMVELISARFKAQGRKKGTILPGT